jgi:hypothetical protein
MPPRRLPLFRPAMPLPLLFFIIFGLRHVTPAAISPLPLPFAIRRFWLRVCARCHAIIYYMRAGGEVPALFSR